MNKKYIQFNSLKFHNFYRGNMKFMIISAVNPIRILIAVCLFSNIGGAATSVGDPPNVLIANDPT